MHRAKKLVHGAVALSSTILLALGWVSDRPASAGASEKSIAGLPARAESGPGAARQWRTGPKSGPVHGVPVRNFGVVDPGCLYRSAQPGDDADYDWLVKQGFRSVVCLREEPAASERVSRLNAQGLT